MSEQDPSASRLTELDQYRRLLDNIPAEIGVFDPAGRFLFNTPSGIPDPAMRQWVLGKTHHDYCRERNHPTEIADRRQAVIERCVSEDRCISFEEIWLDKQGRRRYYVRSFSPAHDDSGAVSHVIGYGQEITELKQTEDALRDEVAARARAEKDLRRAISELRALKERLRQENVYLQEEIRSQQSFADMIGESAPSHNVIHAIETVAPTQANVLVTGETGTGKELVARKLHELSSRRDKPLIKVNCASIPKELFESEFFGHVKGAFTGAIRDRTGRFRLADGGTLFLDEVAEIPLELQSKLLRVLQEGCYERVGSDRTERVDVRVIAATNRDLKREIVAGRFRQDLYYRLNVFPIEVAPLRQRPEDIPPLAEHCLRLVARRANREVPVLTSKHLRRLQSYPWPGNVRELQNVMERALITARGGRIQLALPGEAVTDTHQAPVADVEPSDSDVIPEEVIPEAELRRRARDNTIAALRRTEWRIYGPGGAAQLLGMRPTTLSSRLRKWGIRRPVA